MSEQRSFVLLQSEPTLVSNVSNLRATATSSLPLLYLCSTYAQSTADANLKWSVSGGLTLESGNAPRAQTHLGAAAARRLLSARSTSLCVSTAPICVVSFATGM